MYNQSQYLKDVKLFNECLTICLFIYRILKLGYYENKNSFLFAFSRCAYVCL